MAFDNKGTANTSEHNYVHHLIKREKHNQDFRDFPEAFYEKCVTKHYDFRDALKQCPDLVVATAAASETDLGA